MDLTILAARLLLALIFAIAGVTKLADLAGSRRALRTFGMPEPLAISLGTLLPLVELGVAVALIPAASAWWGALIALFLLFTFAAGIGVNLARGKRPDCHCFGQLHSASAGWPTLTRNGVLAAVTAMVLWQGLDGPGPSMFAWLDDGPSSKAIFIGINSLSILLVLGLGWITLHLLLQHGRVLLRLEALENISGNEISAGGVNLARPTKIGLPLGSTAPAFRLAGMHGEILTLDALRALGKPVLLVFTDPACKPCLAMMPEIGRWQRMHGATITVVVVSRGYTETNSGMVDEYGVNQVLLQRGEEVAHAYHVTSTPTAILVHANGTIWSLPTPGAEAIRKLVGRVTSSGDLRPIIAIQSLAAEGVVDGRNYGSKSLSANYQTSSALNIGDLAPEVRLPDLNGNVVDLHQSKGEPTLMLFWNPDCNFCVRMINDLKVQEANLPPTAPRLLIVSRGSVEANRATQLQSPIVLDERFMIGRAFGVTGTPSAVLVDKTGRIASAFAVGAQEVLTLAASNGT